MTELKKNSGLDPLVNVATGDSVNIRDVSDTTNQATGETKSVTQRNLIRWVKGADIASASALSPGADGNAFDVTGTNAITSINTIGIGTFILLHFDAILTLTHHATNLILPNGVNIATVAGGEGMFYEYDTGKWRCISYSPVSMTEIHGASSKATPVDADELGLVDSAASWVLKKLTWANLKATLKVYFDTLYEKFFGNAYYPDYNEADQGLTGNGKSAKAYIDTIGADSATLVFRHNSGAATTTYTFSTNETIPSNINVVIEKGAVLSDGGGASDLIIGLLGERTGTYKIFDWTGTGSITFSSGAIEAVLPIWWGFLSAASGATNKAAIESAIDSLGTYGGLIRLPFGSFTVAPGITPTKANLTIAGMGNAYSYETGSNAGTRIIFTAGAVGFDLTGRLANGGYTEIKDLYINGNGVLQTGIEIGGAKLLSNVTVSGCTVNGVHISTFGNQTSIHHCSLSYNTGANGLKISSEGGSTTITNITKSNFRSNGVGIYISGVQALSVKECVVESNTSYGLHIYKPTGASVNTLSFENSWFENNNNASNGFQIFIDSQTKNFSSGPPFNIDFRICSINAAGSQKCLGIDSVRYANFDDCNFLGGDTANAIILTTYASYVTIKDKNGGTITDTGNRNFVINKKTGKSKGFNIDGDIFSTGGRLQTFWFVADTITAGSTVYTFPISYNAAGKTLVIKAYPTFAGGSIVGIVIDKDNVVTTASLGIMPYHMLSTHPWNGSVYNLEDEGAHDGANGAAILTDSGESWAVDEHIGKMIYNITDDSAALITDNDATTITGALAGGTDNDWDSGDTYIICTAFMNSADNQVKAVNFLQEDCIFSAGKRIGLRIIAPANYNGGATNKIQIGLVVEY